MASQRARAGRSAHRPRAVWWIPVCLLVWCAGSRAEDEPQDTKPPVEVIRLANIQADPGGDAERLARQAVTAFGEQRFDDAYHELVALAEQHPRVPVAVRPMAQPFGGEDDDALRWPARLAANVMLARLPEPVQERLQARWGAAARILFDRVRRNDRDALQTLAYDFGALKAGGYALRLLADHALAAGDFAAVARHLETWFVLRPAASVSQRLAVTARLGSAYIALDDAGGLKRLVRAQDDLLGERIEIGGTPTTLSRFLARKRKPDLRAEHVDAKLPDAVRLLWTRSVRDTRWLRPRAQRPFVQHRPVVAGALAEPDTLVLHEGRTVRRVDPVTGAELWRYPRVPHPRLHAPSSRYWPHDLPMRDVTRAGNLVFVALGHSSAAGQYPFLAEMIDPNEFGQELRVRLLALDVRTGDVRWMSGAPTDTHPILGDRATGCASPPLIVGDKLYCVFARGRGIGEFFLACLDARTGEPHWVTGIAGGSSGRTPDTSEIERFAGQFLEALPWGARPSLADDEVCVLTHAGFAAGVGARKGTLRWLRALPRYDQRTQIDARAGHSARNAPLAWGDSWILAPLDCPRLLCIARGTGALRWHVGQPSADQAPPWRDLLGVGYDPAGRALLRLNDARLTRLDPRNGQFPPIELSGQWNFGMTGPLAVRPFEQDGQIVTVQNGLLQALAWSPRTAAPAGVAPEPVTVELPDGCPRYGDVYRCGDIWLVLNDDRVAAFADAGYEPDAGGAGTGPIASVRAAQRSRLDDDPAAFERALTAIEAMSDADERAIAFRGAARVLRHWLWRRTLDTDSLGEPAVRRLVRTAATWVARFPSDLRGELYAQVIDALVEHRQTSRAVRLIDEWIADPGSRLILHPDDADLRFEREDGTLRRSVPPEPDDEGGVRLRGDLLAASYLRKLRARPFAQQSLTLRDAEHALTMGKALEADEKTLREAIRHAVGSEAAARGRLALLARMERDARWTAAAAVSADRRLDPTPRQRARAQAFLRDAARWQMKESGWWADRSAPDHARSLAADLVQWAPAGVQDVLGRTPARWRQLLRDTYAVEPVRSDPAPFDIDAWRGLPDPTSRDALSGVRFAGLHGPGMTSWDEDNLVLVRGLSVEVWSAQRGERRGALPGNDEGWFGGSLNGVHACVPGGGILVTNVVAAEPADKSGVHSGDWIRTWNGEPVADMPAFMRRVSETAPGRTVPVEVYRNGKLILEKFTAGRRPVEEKPPMEYGELWVAEDGRVLFPGRRGLSWVDPVALTREPAWTWDGDGVVRRVRVIGGEAYVHVERRDLGDFVVRVDMERGEELWRRRVDGRVLDMQATGSALWVRVTRPAAGWLLDRHDGTVRGAYRAIDMRRDEYRRTWVPGHATDAAPAGRAFVVDGDVFDPILHYINTTTGLVEHSEEWTAPEPQFDPMVSADAFVAVIRGASNFHFHVADPLGRTPPESHSQTVESTLLFVDQTNGGRFSADARIRVLGNRVYIVRNTPAHKVTVWIAELDVSELPERVGRPSSSAPQRAGQPLKIQTRAMMLSGARYWPYVLQIDPTFEGVFVTAAFLGNDHDVHVSFITPTMTARPFFDGKVQDARRHGPVRSGNRVVIPHDRGARIVGLAKPE